MAMTRKNDNRNRLQRWNQHLQIENSSANKETANFLTIANKAQAKVEATIINIRHMNQTPFLIRVFTIWQLNNSDGSGSNFFDMSRVGLGLPHLGLENFPLKNTKYFNFFPSCQKNLIKSG